MQELSVYERKAMLEAMQAKATAHHTEMLRDLERTKDRKMVYEIPQDFHGVAFSVGAEKSNVKLTVNGVDYMLTPEGAKDLGNGLLRLAGIVRGDKPKRRRHG